MQTIEEHILIQGTPEQLFELSQDYVLRLQWDPFIRDIQFLNKATKNALGVCVWVKAWTSLTMVAQYITFDPPNVAAIKMISGPKFFSKFFGSWRFKPHYTGATEVIFKYAFQVRWQWLEWLLNPIIALVFQHDITLRLKGLKQSVEKDNLLAQLKKCY